MLSLAEARAKVIEVVRRADKPVTVEKIALAESLGRVLARPIVADRDYPPFDRSTRDGFAVRAAEVSQAGAALEIIGEARAGTAFTGAIGPGQCVEIMTGAGVPSGGDAVIMSEHARIEGRRVRFDRAPQRGQNIVPRATEARAGAELLAAGTPVGAAEIGVAAQVGCARLNVARRPRLAVLSTGDEVVGVDDAPTPLEVRNSNGVSIAALARLAGAQTVPLGNARDNANDLRRGIERGLECDVLVLSGGVSAGKYDFVEPVLRELGAEFIFDGVAIRPGRPVLFGVCRGKLVFGLPGNPASTLVTFELFVRPVLEVLQGADPRELQIVAAKLAAPVRQNAALTYFLPARLESRGGEPVVQELPWPSSGDIVALSHATGFLIVRPERLELAAGDWAEYWPRRDAP
ncbi:MAG TPA: gephyrin-like molybdotransferase Glp [Methylomirabilota bacterium]|nr:gephyrin-like molybdotransferase Glp [Methylomirabilota bacterium]